MSERLTAEQEQQLRNTNSAERIYLGRHRIWATLDALRADLLKSEHALEKSQRREAIYLEQVVEKETEVQAIEADLELAESRIDLERERHGAEMVEMQRRATKQREMAERMEAALLEAAQSLETLARAGLDMDLLSVLSQVRGYASGRATVARAVLKADGGGK